MKGGVSVNTNNMINKMRACFKLALINLLNYLYAFKLNFLVI